MEAIKRTIALSEKIAYEVRLNSRNINSGVSDEFKNEALCQSPKVKRSSLTK